MNKVFLSVFFSFCLTVFPPESYCQAPVNTAEWSLKQCIDYAIGHNLQVKQSELNVQISGENFLQAKAQSLPNLNGFATHNYNFGQTIDPYTNQFAIGRVQSNNFGLSSNLTLFNGMQTYHEIRQNQYNLMASKSDADKMKNDISISVTMAFLQLLFGEELESAAKNQATITRMQVERMQKMVNAGALPKSKLLELEAQLAQEDLNLVNASNQKELAYLNLKQLLELDINAAFIISRPSLQLPEELSISSTPGQVYDAALTILPEIKSAEFRLLSSANTLKIAHGARSPKLSLQGSLASGFSGLKKDITDVTVTGYQSSGYYTQSGEEIVEPTFDVKTKVRSFDKQIDDNFNKSIGLNLSVPIFNSLSVKTNISKAKIAKQQAENDLAITENQVRKNIQQAYADAAAALKKFHATKKTTEAFEESFKYADKRFNVGDINAVEYNDAKNKLAKSQSDLLQAKYDFIFKQKLLDFYQGKSLVF